MQNDPLANTMSNILNQERTGKKECTITPVSKVIKKVLEIMSKHRYIGALEQVHEAKGGLAKVNLIGAINKCGVIKPRFSVKVDGYEKFEKRYLPSKTMGILIVSTTKGILTHTEAKQKKLGGKLIAYCY